MNFLFSDLSKIRTLGLSQWSARHREALLSWLAVFDIMLWAMWVASPYLNTSTTLWPAGTGLGTKLLGHHVWPALQQCGICALWNGTHNGGRPALADIFGSQLHPLVMVTTLLWGVIGGAKITIVGIMVMAGIAQWWIARLLKLGHVASLGSALVAVAGGHLIVQNDEGNFGIMLSTAAASLAIAAVLALAVNLRRKDTVVLAFVGALVLFSGQGYMQLALLAWAPALLLFSRRREGQRSFVRELLLAVGLAILIAGVLIAPTAHFWPNFTKETADPNFGFAQPLEYIPLNLVIRDLIFYGTGNILGRQPHTELLFVGWIPVLFALLSLRFVRRDNFAQLAFLASGAFLSFFIASAIPLRFLARWFPFLLGFRFPSLMSGLAVPAILALAAFGLDELLKLQFPRLEISLKGLANKSTVAFNAKWFLLIVLVISLQQVYDFSRSFIYLRDMSKIYQGLAVLQTSQSEWVAPPGGEVDWVEPAIDNGLKITNVIYSGANWSGRDLPMPYLIAERNAQPKDSIVAGDMLGAQVYRIPTNEYAFVQIPDGQTSPCIAQARGGTINVECSTAQSGQLIVRENTFNGWFAWRDNDNASLPLLGGTWLSVQAPSGNHVYKFAYLPWDAALGFLITVVGIIASISLLTQRQPADKTAFAPKTAMPESGAT